MLMIILKLYARSNFDAESQRHHSAVAAALLILAKAQLCENWVQELIPGDLFVIINILPLFIIIFIVIILLFK